MKIIKSWDDFPADGIAGIDYDFAPEFARYILKDYWGLTDEEIAKRKQQIVDQDDQK